MLNKTMLASISAVTSNLLYMSSLTCAVTSAARDADASVSTVDVTAFRFFNTELEVDVARSSSGNDCLSNKRTCFRSVILYLCVFGTQSVIFSQNET